MKNLSVKINTMVGKLKTYWRTPPKGYYVSYKEFLNLALGSGSLSFSSVLITWTTIAINVPMMISYSRFHQDSYSLPEWLRQFSAL